MQRSVSGLMDVALPDAEQRAIRGVLQSHLADGVQFHALRTRQSGSRQFVSMHVLVPGALTVQRGHELLEEIEAQVRAAVPNVTVTTHLEPLEDPCSWEDLTLDRADARRPPPGSAR